VRGQNVGTLTVLRHRVDLPALDDVDRENRGAFRHVCRLAIGKRDVSRRASVEVLRRSEARAVQATMFLDAIIENIPTWCSSRTRSADVRALQSPGENSSGFRATR